MIGLAERVSDPVGSGWVLAIALVFFSAGCLLLVFTGGTLGALHAFAAFIVLAIVAALNQLLPVLTHAPVARPRWVVAIASGFAVGFAFLIAGFYGASTFLEGGAILALSALVWVGWNIVRLLAGKGEVQTRALVTCAVVAFAVAAALGALMAGTFAGTWAVPIATLAPLHATVAILGFASLLIVTISYRFVPMFAVAHGTAYGRKGAQWIAVGSVVIVAFFVDSPAGRLLGFVGLLIAALSIGVSHVKTLASRLRKRLDVSLRYGFVAWCLGIAALVAAILETWQSRFGMSAVMLAMLGWISIAIVGYSFKVAGFLAWQTAKDRNPLAQLPALSSAVNLPLAYVALTLLAVGTAVCAVCSLAKPEHVWIGYDIYAVGGLSAVAALTKLTVSYVARKPIDATSARALG